MINLNLTCCWINFKTLSKGMKIKLIYQNSTQNLSFIMVYHLKKILFFSSQCYIHVHVKLNKIMTSCKATYRLPSILQHPRNVTKINWIFWKNKTANVLLLVITLLGCRKRNQGKCWAWFERGWCVSWFICAQTGWMWHT